MRSLAAALILSSVVFSANATGPDPVYERVFIPDHRLPGRAGNVPHASDAFKDPAASAGAWGVSPVRTPELSGQAATHTINIPALPDGACTVEMWIVDHVNRPVGVAVSDGEWATGVFGGRAVSLHHTKLQTSERLPKVEGHWRHIVIVRDADHRVTVYSNGQPVLQDAERATPGHSHASAAALAFYLAEEPYMAPEHLLRGLRVFDTALNEETIAGMLAERRETLQQGVLHRGDTHFTASPTLQPPRHHEQTILWETSAPAAATLRWGSTGELDMGEIALDADTRLKEATITGLQPNTTYFYEVTAEDPSRPGQTLSSGLLTFKTAPGPGQPLQFAVIGDTEARVHINARVAELMWGERPDFVLSTGDMTDGGKAHARWEWTHEYMLGMAPLHARVPVVPVPGNGEGDLVWYHHYHNLPQTNENQTETGYYSLRVGDAELFMLDSNRSREGFAPGGEQYQWLDEQLSKSDAVWKFVAHHHPTYSGDEDDYGDSWHGHTVMGDTNVQQILPLYERHGVDIVFFGHLHTYQRSHPVRDGKVVPPGQGVVHIQTGGGGGNLEDFTPTRNWFSAKTYANHHYCTVSIDNGTLTLRMYDLQGALRDELTISKPAPAPTTAAASTE